MSSGPTSVVRCTDVLHAPTAHVSLQCGRMSGLYRAGTLRVRCAPAMAHRTMRECAGAVPTAHSGCMPREPEPTMCSFKTTDLKAMSLLLLLQPAGYSVELCEAAQFCPTTAAAR
jgi:hypothetical protein